MSDLIKIDGQAYSTDDLVNFLKLNNEFDELVEKFIRFKVTVQAARKKGIAVSGEEVQQAADDFRRYAGMHRAKDTMNWLDAQKLSVDDFEGFVTDQLYHRKVRAEVTGDDKIEEYFQLHSPKFDSVDINHLVIEGKEQANELYAQLQDDSGLFGEFVNDYSLDEETKASGGLLGNIRRGGLEPDVETKVFNAAAGDILSPFQLGEENLYEIIQVKAAKPAQKDDSTKAAIGETLFEEWLAARMEEHSVSTD